MVVYAIEGSLPDDGQSPEVVFEEIAMDLPKPVYGSLPDCDHPATLFSRA